MMLTSGTIFWSIYLQPILIFTIIFLVLYWYWNLPRGVPPGPPNLPIIGSVPFLRLPLHVHFQSLRKRYGDVISAYFGSQLVVVLNSYDVIKEAYVQNGDSASGRIQFDHLKITGDYDAGVFNTEGPSWKEQRRFMISTLRDFGMGKQTLEYKIQEEICALKDELKEQNGNAMNIRLLMNTTVSNIICSILIGHRFAYDDPEFKSNLEKLNTMFERAHFLLLGEKLAFLRNLPGDPIKVRRGFLLFVEKLAFLRNLPGDPIKVSRRFLLLRGKLDFLQNLPGDPIKYQWIMDCFLKESKVWINEYVRKHAESFDRHHLKDFIDVYLARIETKKLAGIETHMTDKTIFHTILDIFIAGTETTATTLRWAFFYMALYPEVQGKVQAEIDENVGRSRLPRALDRPSLPYTGAVIQEIMRSQPITPLGVPHRATQDFTLNGFKIPNDTLMFANLYAVHHDAKNFKDPEEFRPERFLSEDGKTVLKPKFLIPFGIGRRICAGETLAQMELFLYFTTLLQRFSFKSPEGAPPLDPDMAEPHITLAPPEHELCVIWRED